MVMPASTCLWLAWPYTQWIDKWPCGASFHSLSRTCHKFALLTGIVRRSPTLWRQPRALHSGSHLVNPLTALPLSVQMYSLRPSCCMHAMMAGSSAL